MPVVINDFEVVAEPPPATGAGQNGGDQTGKEPERPTAAEVLRWLHERHERVRAH